MPVSECINIVSILNQWVTCVDVFFFSKTEEMQVDLAQPEFEGLWSKKTKPQKDQRVVRPVGATKMEQASTV